MMFFLTWPWYYITGMWRYRTDNHTSREAILGAVYSETAELLDAIHTGTTWEVLDEGCDVLHSLLLLWAWDFANILGLGTGCTKVLMVCLPIFAVSTAMKHAKRVKSHNCVRNLHHCHKRNHNCGVGKIN